MQRKEQMKRFNWQIILSLALIMLSAILYFIHYLIFRDARHIFIYLLGDIAFIPVEVLLVTLVIHQLLNAREKRAMLKKLNMVVGAFFSEVGTGLLKTFSYLDEDIAGLQSLLIVNKDWKQKDFLKLKNKVKSRELNINIKKTDLDSMRNFLISKREFLLGLLENPNLLEHETFTELLWAVFHLTEELSFRGSFVNLPDADYEHLSGDIKRAYVLIIFEWLAYMEHLSVNYPYLFSLAIRTNPFDSSASVVLI